MISMVVVIIVVVVIIIIIIKIKKYVHVLFKKKKNPRKTIVRCIENHSSMVQICINWSKWR